MYCLVHNLKDCTDEETGGMVECQEVDDAANMVVHVGGTKDDYGSDADDTMATVVRKAKKMKSVKAVAGATR